MFCSADLCVCWIYFLTNQGVGHNDEKVLVLAATNTPYALDQVMHISIYMVKRSFIAAAYRFCAAGYQEAF